MAATLSIFSHIFSTLYITYKTEKASVNEYRGFYLVVLPGLEPGISGPESDVLPLHHRTIYLTGTGSVLNYAAKIEAFFILTKICLEFLWGNKHFPPPLVLILSRIHIIIIHKRCL